MNTKDKTEKIGNRYYCIPCADKRKEEVKKNNDGWDELFNYICQLYNIEKPTGQMFAQLRRFRTDYNYKNKGMYLTLKYFHEVLGNEVKEDTGLGIIEYEYENARRHYMNQKRVKKYMEEFEHNEEIREVRINPSLRTKAKIKQLSFENIVDEGDVNAESS